MSSPPLFLEESIVMRLKDSLQEILQCPICLEKLTKPMTCLQCKTNFCDSCLKVYFPILLLHRTGKKRAIRLPVRSVVNHHPWWASQL